MSLKSAHANRIYSSTQTGSAAVSPIVASWMRCMTVHRMCPEDVIKPTVLTSSELRNAQEASERLIIESSDEMDRFFGTIGKAGCSLLLTDVRGVVLERRCQVADDHEFRSLGLWDGALWNEAQVGTNAIGTALADERPVMVYRDDHFLSANISMCCTTAPIRDHRGMIIGALDISTCRKDVSELSFSIITQAVRDCAQRIEFNLFKQKYAASRMIVVPNGALGSVSLIAVDKDDLIVGATRAARLALNLDDAMIVQGIPAADALNEQRDVGGSDLFEAERAALRRALSRANGNVTMAASSLGISRATLHRKMNKLSVS